MVFRGLDNIVIVDSDDALFVAAKGKVTILLKRFIMNLIYRTEVLLWKDL